LTTHLEQLKTHVLHVRRDVAAESTNISGLSNNTEESVGMMQRSVLGHMAPAHSRERERWRCVPEDHDFWRVSQRAFTEHAGVASGVRNDAVRPALQERRRSNKREEIN
jgi:hypothetical protein